MSLFVLYKHNEVYFPLRYWDFFTSILTPLLIHRKQIMILSFPASKKLMTTPSPYQCQMAAIGLYKNNQAPLLDVCPLQKFLLLQAGNGRLCWDLLTLSHKKKYYERVSRTCRIQNASGTGRYMCKWFAVILRKYLLHVKVVPLFGPNNWTPNLQQFFNHSVTAYLIQHIIKKL